MTFASRPHFSTRFAPASRRAVVAAGLALLAGAAAAQAYPAKQISFVNNFPPGGPSDMIARSVADVLQKRFSQPVVVENKPGAAGNIAMQEVANSTDEHTIILGHIGTLAVNPYIFPKLPYDANRDFAPITLVSKVPSLYVVHPDLPVKNIKEFVALAKAKPGQLNYGSAGNGSAGHLAMEYLKMVSNTFMLHVPYRGTGPMLTDLMAGRLQAASVGAPALLSFIKAGKLRCIGTGTGQRLPQLPDVPTVAEQGFAGFEMTQWYGLLAPREWSPGHLAKLEAEAVKATRGALVKDKLAQETALAVGNSSAEFAQFIATEQKRWSQVIARAQIKPEGMG